MSQRGRETRTIVLHIDAGLLARGVELLADGSHDQRIEVALGRAVSQSRGYARLRLVAHRADGWWEHSGLAVRLDSALDGRRIVVDRQRLERLVCRAAPTAGTASVTVEWRGGGLEIGGYGVVPAAGGDVAPLPDTRDPFERVHIPEPGPEVQFLETPLGRVALPGALLVHLARRRARVAELVVAEGCVYLVARASMTAPAAVVPITVAPLDVATPVAVPAPAAPPVAVPMPVVVPAPVAVPAAVPAPEMPAAVSAPATPVVPADDLPAPARDEEQPVMRDGVGVPGVEAVVRAAIAADPSTSPEVLDLFAQDADPSVRVGAAMNPAVRPAILEWLSGDDDAAVRAAVAANERTHAAALARLGCDDDPRVSAAVAANIACPCDVLSELAPGLAYFVLANPNAPSEVLAAGARMPDPVLRAQVARNLATAPSVLGALTGDEDPLVLRSVAENPASPDAVTRRARARLAACGADPAPHIASA